MQHKLINHSPDLTRLVEEGLEVEIKDNFLLVHHIPYVNFDSKIKYGILVSELRTIGEKTTTPGTHVIYFIGNHPCNKDGTIISQINHSSNNQELSKNITINHSFSNKPSGGYQDYYSKISRYIEIITAPAKSLDNTVSEKTFYEIDSFDSSSVFNYSDSNSTRAEITNISCKLNNQKIAIIGLGGTGSYLVDLVSKTSVKEIHLYDGDIFQQHNAFRAPGAPPEKLFNQNIKKVNYFANIYSNMHKNICPHDCYISTDNMNELLEVDFVFICLDNDKAKKEIVDFLIAKSIPFIDVGMGVNSVNNKLLGILRVTASTQIKNDHVYRRIPMEDEGINEYSKNIQLAELNSLNAAFAVIKWKKLFNFYHDNDKENNLTYTIDTNLLIGDEHDS